MELPKIGTGVDYLSKASADGETTTQEGVIIGFDPMPEGSSAEFPPAQLAYLHPDRLGVLASADWRTAFDRVSSVPHFSGAHGARHCYRLRSAAVAPAPVDHSHPSIHLENAFKPAEPVKIPVKAPLVEKGK